MRIRLTPPFSVSGSPRRSHDAADPVGMNSDQRSTSISKSYIASGFALDSCSTRHDKDPFMLPKGTTGAQLNARFRRITRVREQPEVADDRVLATVLFTDIVDSTRRAA